MSTTFTAASKVKRKSLQKDIFSKQISSDLADLTGTPTRSRVSQLRRENSNCADWESDGEKEFHGTVNIVQSWDELSLDSASTDEDSSSRESADSRFSASYQRCFSMSNLASSLSPSASSSPSSSPKILPGALSRSRSLSRFSPFKISPRKTFTSLSPLTTGSVIKMRPSKLSIERERGVKRKCDWSSNQEDALDQRSKTCKR